MLAAVVGLGYAWKLHSILGASVQGGNLAAEDRSRFVRAFLVFWVSLIGLMLLGPYLAGVPSAACLMGAPIGDRRSIVLLSMQLAATLPALAWIWLSDGADLLARVFGVLGEHAPFRTAITARRVRLGALLLAALGVATIFIPFPNASDGEMGSICEVSRPPG